MQTQTLVFDIVGRDKGAVGDKHRKAALPGDSPDIAAVGVGIAVEVGVGIVAEAEVDTVAGAEVDTVAGAEVDTVVEAGVDTVVGAGVDTVVWVVLALWNNHRDVPKQVG